MSVRPPAHLVALVQGAYYVLAGLWPILHIGSFYAVTGPKTDDWLVQTVGALIVAVGLSLLAAAWRRAVAVPTRVLGAASALAFVAVEVTFYLQGLLRWVYLADAALHVLILAAWALAQDRPEDK